VPDIRGQAAAVARDLLAELAGTQVVSTGGR